MTGPSCGNPAFRAAAILDHALFVAGFAALALVAFAANSIFCRLALESAIDPASYTVVRLISGACMLWAITRLRESPAPGDSPRGVWASALALFLYAGAFSFAYESLSAGTGALILFAGVQATMIAAGVRGGERPGPWEWTGLAAALGGLVYLVSPGLTAPAPIGSVLMSVAGVAWGIYSLRGRGNTDPIRATTANFLRAGLMAPVLWLFARELHFNLTGAVWAFLSGAVSSALGYVAWYVALRQLTATRAATIQLAVPVIAAAGGVTFLDEPVTFRLIVSAVAILGGIGLATSRPVRRPPARASVRTPAIRHATVEAD